MITKNRSVKKQILALAVAAAGLAITGMAKAANFTWDGNGNGAGITDASGIWSATNVNWVPPSGTGTADAAWPNDFSSAVFGEPTSNIGTSTVSVQGSLNVNSITFAQTTGTFFTLTQGASGQIVFGGSDTPTITNNNTHNSMTLGVTFTDATDLAFAGIGTVNLSGIGDTVGGNFNLGGTTTIGITNGITLTSATATINANAAATVGTANDVSFITNTGLTIAGTSTLTLNGLLNVKSGGIAFTDTATTTLGGPNVIFGGITIGTAAAASSVTTGTTAAIDGLGASGANVLTFVHGSTLTLTAATNQVVAGINGTSASDTIAGSGSGFFEVETAAGASNSFAGRLPTGGVEIFGGSGTQTLTGAFTAANPATATFGAGVNGFGTTFNIATGAVNYPASIIVTGGTLSLDHAAGGVGASSGSGQNNNLITSTDPLALSGGTLKIVGSGTTFAMERPAIVLAPGASGIMLVNNSDPGTAATGVALASGPGTSNQFTWEEMNGGTLLYTAPSGANASVAGGANGLFVKDVGTVLGSSRIFGNASSIFGGWAAIVVDNSASNIAGVAPLSWGTGTNQGSGLFTGQQIITGLLTSSYINTGVTALSNGSSATQNFDVAATPVSGGNTIAASTSVNTLRFNDAAGGAVTIASGQTLTINAGGILVTNNLGSNAASISGGTISVKNTAYWDTTNVNNAYAAIGGELLIHQYDTTTPFTISSTIANAADPTPATTTGTVSYQQSGTGNNTIAVYNSNGAGGSGYTVLFRPTAANLASIQGFAPGMGISLTSANGTVNGTIVGMGITSTGFGGTYNINTVGGEYVVQVFFASNPGFSTTAGTDTAITASTYTSNNALVKSGPGDLILSGANSYTGATFVDQGVLRLQDANALPGGIDVTGGTSALWLDGGVLGLGDGGTNTSFNRAIGNTASTVQWMNSGGFAAYGSNNATYNSSTVTVNLGGSGAALNWGGKIGNAFYDGTTPGTNVINANTGFVPDGDALLFGTATATGNINFQNPINLNDGVRTIRVTGGVFSSLSTPDATISGAIANGAPALGTANTNFGGSTAGTGIAAGALIIEGTGNLELTGVNTYTGFTQVSNGGLILGPTGSMASPSLILGSATGGVPIGGTTDAGGNYVGGTSTAGNGIFQLGDANGAASASFNAISVAPGAGSGNAIVGGNGLTSTLTVNNTVTDNFAGTLGGAGPNQNNLAVIMNGAGVLTLSNTNTFIGGLTINAGTVQAGAVNALGSGNVTFGTTTTESLDLNGNDQTVGLFSGGNSSDGVITNSAAGTGANTLTLTGTGTATFGGVIQDGATARIALALTSGIQILSGINTYTGGTTISGGTLQGTTVSLQGAITNNSTLIFDQASAGTYAGAIGGNGAVAINGAGNVKFTGANNYSGNTRVNNGTLTLNNTTGNVLGTSAISVGGAGNAATLAVIGNNTTGGSLTVNGDGGVGALSLVDASINSLTLGGSFSLGGASTKAIFNMEVDNSGGYDSIALGSNAFVLGAAGATFNFTEIGSGPLATGVYNLITFGSTSGGALVFSNNTTTTVFGSQILTLNNTGTAETLTVAAGNPAPPAAWFKGNHDASWATLVGGLASNFTTDAAGATDAGAVPDSTTNVHFYADGASNAGASTLDASISINSLTIDGSAHPVTPQSNDVAIGPGTGGILTIFAGASGGHTLGDGITINSGSGAVAISAPLVLGAAQTWTNNGSNGFTSTGGVATDGFALTLAGSGDNAISSITGAGSLTQNTTGTTTLNGASNYSGGTTVSQGTLAGSATGGLQGDILNNAALNFTGGGAYAGSITGSGAVEISSGNVTFSGTGNSYNGGTVIDNPATLSGGPTNFSANSSITDNGILAVTASGTMNQNIGGPGILTKTGDGTLILGGTNNYNGGTTLTTGGLQGTTTSLQGNIAAANSTTIAFSQAGPGTYSGAITGGNSAALAISGGGTITVSGNNSFTGGTAVSGGSTISVALLADSGASNLGNAGTLGLSAGTLLYTGSSTSTARNVSITPATGGTITVQSSSAILHLTGNVTGIAANATLTVNGAGTLELANATNNTNLANASVTNGTLLLNASNTSGSIHAIYGGTITVGANGTLQFGLGTSDEIGHSAGGQAATNIAVNGNGVVDMNGSNQTFNALTSSSSSALVTNSASSTLSILNYGRGGTGGTFAGVIEDGNGTVGISVNDNATLSGANTYTGPTAAVFHTITAGVSSVAGVSGAFGNNAPLVFNAGSVDLAGFNTQVGSLTSLSTGNIALGGATLTTAGGTANPTYASTTFSGNITSATGGGFTKSGSYTQILTGTGNTYNGPTNITAGALIVSGASSINSSSGVTLNGPTATFLNNSSVAITSPITITQGTIGGSGTFSPAGGISIGTGAVVSPGNSPAAQPYTTGFTFAPGGAYHWEINDANGIAGANYDQLVISGGSPSGLNITATSGTPFTIDISSLTALNAPGALANFDNTQSHAWMIAANSGITGYDPTEFNISTANFTNALGGGTFGTSVVGNDLFVTFTPAAVPEPTSLALFGLGAAALLRRRRRA